MTAIMNLEYIMLVLIMFSLTFMRTHWKIANVLAMYVLLPRVGICGYRRSSWQVDTNGLQMECKPERNLVQWVNYARQSFFQIGTTKVDMKVKEDDNDVKVAGKIIKGMINIHTFTPLHFSNAKQQFIVDIYSQLIYLYLVLSESIKWHILVLKISGSHPS